MSCVHRGHLWKWTITAEIAREICDNGVARVSVSLDGATADLHGRMRRMPWGGAYATTGAHITQEPFCAYVPEAAKGMTG